MQGQLRGWVVRHHSIQKLARKRRLALGLVGAVLALGAVSCKSSSSGSDTSRTPAAARSCPADPGGTVWVPNVPGSGASNRDSGVSVLKDTYTSGNVPLLNLTSSIQSSNIVTIPFTMDTDLLAGGSFTLTAELNNYPTQLEAGWPILLSVSDGTHEFVNFDLSACATQGLFSSCTSSSCTRNTACGPDPGGTLGSAFLGATALERRIQWEQRQKVLQDDSVSVSTFPSCNWTSGSPACPFRMTPSGGAPTNGYFGSAPNTRLRFGGNYTARYAILAPYTSGAQSYQAGVKLTVHRKRDPNTSSAGTGAMDVNVILVGSQNIADSRTAKGQQNLNELMRAVYAHYFTENSGTAGIRLGEINAFEWNCGNGGDTYANYDADLIADLFQVGSTVVSASTEGRAINLFLVSTMPFGGTGTLLGIAGGIGGVPLNRTTASGVAIATFDELATHNPACTPGSSCPATSWTADFFNLGVTISHEVGHFLGLNHPSESSGTQHDPLPDTVQCTTTQVGTNPARITRSSCGCAGGGASPCSPNSNASLQPNLLMWWTDKGFASGTGDGNLISTQSGFVINSSVYVQ